MEQIELLFLILLFLLFFFHIITEQIAKVQDEFNASNKVCFKIEDIKFQKKLCDVSVGKNDTIKKIINHNVNKVN